MPEETISIEELHRLAEQGNANAQNNLGVCYYNGQGIPQSYEKAVYWYTKTAEQWYADAQNNLGCCYYNGWGVPQSYEKAVYWYTKAAEQGDVYAQYNLGLCYDNGLGVAKSVEQAKKWYAKAAEQGHENAKNRLSQIQASEKPYFLDYEAAEIRWNWEREEAQKREADKNFQDYLDYVHSQESLNSGTPCD